MPPLGKVVLGFLLVVVDLRINGFDLIPDVLGWLLVLAGLLPLQVAEPGPVLGFLEVAAQTVLVFGTCTGVRSVVTDPRVRQTADRIRCADLVLAGLGATLAVAVWFLVFVWSQRGRPELLPAPGTADGLEPGTP